MADPLSVRLRSEHATVTEQLYAADLIEGLISENAALVAALQVCAADYISPPCTMSDAYPLVAAEFRRRMRTANEALGQDMPTPLTNIWE